MKKIFILLVFLVITIASCTPASDVVPATQIPTVNPTVTNSPMPSPTLTPLPTLIPARLDFPMIKGVDFFFQNDQEVMHFCLPGVSITQIKEFYSEQMPEFGWKEAGYGCKVGVFTYPTNYVFLNAWVKTDDSEQVDFWVMGTIDGAQTCMIIEFTKCR